MVMHRLEVTWLTVDASLGFTGTGPWLSKGDWLEKKGSFVRVKTPVLNLIRRRGT